jgi:heme exporter protein C
LHFVGRNVVIVSSLVEKLIFIIYDMLNTWQTKGLWWKVAGVIIFIVVLIGGLCVPLRPGVTSSQPANAKNGDTLFMNVIGYNTHFSTANNQRAWLKLDSIHAIAAKAFFGKNENEAVITFYIPKDLPTSEKVRPLTLIIDNELDGAFVQPNALFLTIEDNPTQSGSSWTQADLTNLSVASGMKFPYRNILNETIRNTFFHVALWFAMFILLIAGLYHAIQCTCAQEIMITIFNLHHSIG